MSAIQKVILSVMQVRDGRDGSPIDYNDTIPSEHVKIELDSNDEPSEGSNQASDDEIRVRCYVDGKLDLEFDGHGDIKGSSPQAFVWPANGRIWSHPCYHFFVKLHAGYPDNRPFKLEIETEHAGVVSNRVSFNVH